MNVAAMESARLGEAVIQYTPTLDPLVTGRCRRFPYFCPMAARVSTVIVVRISPAEVTVDCHDPFALADWWRDRLGWRDVYRTEHRAHAIIEAVDGSGWKMCFVQVPDPTPGKNRLHVDFFCADRDVAAAELVAAGATEVRRDGMDDYGWVVLADPEGNVFCVSSSGR